MHVNLVSMKMNRLLKRLEPLVFGETSFYETRPLQIDNYCIVETFLNSCQWHWILQWFWSKAKINTSKLNGKNAKKGELGHGEMKYSEGNVFGKVIREKKKETRRNRRKNKRTVWYKESDVGVFFPPFPALAISAMSNAHLSLLWEHTICS